MRLGRRDVLLGGSALLLGACTAPAKTEADLILHGGQVLTVDAKFAKASAVAVKGGRIVAVGGPELVENWTAPRIVDLAGRTLMPGFNDTHVHIYSLSPRAIEPDKVKSIAELQDVSAREGGGAGQGRVDHRLWLGRSAAEREAQSAAGRSRCGGAGQSGDPDAGGGAFGGVQFEGAGAGEDHAQDAGPGERGSSRRMLRASPTASSASASTSWSGLCRTIHSRRCGRAISRR